MISFILILISISYYGRIRDKTHKPKSKNFPLKSLSHREFDKCKHKKLTTKSPNTNDVENIFFN